MRIVLLIVGIVIFWSVLKRLARRAFRRLPRELRDAKLVMTETGLGSQWPQVWGQIDCAYQLPGGAIVPVEFKTRRDFGVRAGDKVQLSLYGWLLRKNGYTTHDHGYVVIQHKSGKRKWRPVELADDTQCLAWIKRYEGLMSGEISPSRINDGRCKLCGHYRECYQ